MTEVDTLCEEEVIISLVKLLAVYNVSVSLEQLINPLLDDPHKCHHVELCDPLGPKQLFICYAIQQIEDTLYAGHDTLQLPMGDVVISLKVLCLLLNVAELRL